MLVAAVLFLSACGQTQRPSPELTVDDVAVVVPFGYGSGRTATVAIARVGGLTGPVDLVIDDTALPSGVSISSTALTFSESETAKSVTLISDDSVGIDDLGRPLALPLTATADGFSASGTLSVTVSGVVLNPSMDSSVEGSLAYLDSNLPSWTGGDLIDVAFDAEAFADPTTIEMLVGGLTVKNGWHLQGPVDGDGAPYVTLSGNPAGGRILGIKDGLVMEVSNLILAGGQSSSPGGAIHNWGDLTVRNSVIRGGVAAMGGGLFNQMGSTATLVGTLVTGNGDGSTLGGGIYNNGGTVELLDSVVAGNQASSGGGVYNVNATMSGTTYVGRVSLTDTTVTGNTATNSGGGLHNAVGAEVFLIDAEFIDNGASNSGGGVDNDGTVIVVESEFSGNDASAGGGIYSSGDLRISRSTLAANEATSNGGGVFSNGALVVTNSTFTGNVAQRSGGLLVSSNVASIATVTFSTFAGNEARQMTGGSGSVHGGGISYTGTLDLHGTILAGNASESGTGPDLYDGGGTLTSMSYNLVQDPADSGLFGATNIINQDPLLGSLDDNGGPTRTLAPAASSPALDAVPTLECVDDKGEPLTTDQRGEARPAGGACDIGAYEVR